MKNVLRTSAVIGIVLVVAACGRQEPEPVASPPAQTPIYAKDGTVVGYRPSVTSGGMDMNTDDNMSD